MMENGRNRLPSVDSSYPCSSSSLTKEGSRVDNHRNNNNSNSRDDGRPFADPTKMSTKERLRRLQAICKPGKTPLVSANERRNVSRKKRRHVEHLDSAQGKRFACSASGGIDACLRRWMLHGTRVHVKLRASSAQQEPNRLLQGAIVAFDKHWNIVLRDVDEVYMPANRLGKVQSMPGAMPQSVRYYLEDKQAPRRLLIRHLKCSLVTGTSIIAIYNEQSC